MYTFRFCFPPFVKRSKAQLKKAFPGRIRAASIDTEGRLGITDRLRRNAGSFSIPHGQAKRKQFFNYFFFSKLASPTGLYSK